MFLAFCFHFLFSSLPSSLLSYSVDPEFLAILMLSSAFWAQPPEQLGCHLSCSSDSSAVGLLYCSAWPWWPSFLLLSRILGIFLLL